MIKLVRTLGIAGVIIPYLFIFASIILSPWFNFYNNALSDLGNVAHNGYVAYIFNWGLMITGLLVTSFALLLSYVKYSWKFLIWTPLLLITSTDLILIGVFSEDAGKIHGIVSIVFFLMMIVTMFVYSYVSWPLGSPQIGALALIFGFVSTVVWFGNWPWSGLAIQELATVIMNSAWLILISFKNV
jgi:hypothetical membrane protein